MRTRHTAIIGIAACAFVGSARADHDHVGMHMDDASQQVTAGVSLLAANFSSDYYGGNYQGVQPNAHWSYGPIGAGASIAFYRLDSNGLITNGIGDVTAEVDARVWQTDRVTLGVMLAVSVPTGEESLGYGMGHTMMMPMAMGSWLVDRVTLSATAGYGRALVDLGGHVHGMWPLVDPMNMQEVTFGGGGDVAISHGVHGGLHVSGGVPFGTAGKDRVIGAARMAWGSRRVETSAELQAGLAGDPFGVRGVIETALRF